MLGKLPGVEPQKEFLHWPLMRSKVALPRLVDVSHSYLGQLPSKSRDFSALRFVLLGGYMYYCHRPTLNE